MSNSREWLLTRITAPSSEPVSLDEAKLYMRVDTDAADALISDLIVAARMAAEDFLRKSLITQSWKLVYDGYVDCEIDLPMPPVVNIVSVVASERDGTSQTISQNNYYLNSAKNKLVFDSEIVGFNISITYNTGYGSASAVPAPIKYGIMSHISSMYDNRGNSEVPRDSTALYIPFREVLL